MKIKNRLTTCLRFLGLAIIALVVEQVGFEGPAMASREIQKMWDVAPGSLVTVELLSGDLQVVGWDRQQVELSGTLGHEDDELLIKTGESESSIQVKPAKGYGLEREETTLTLRMPRGCTLRAETVSGDSHITGVGGRVEVVSVSGQLTIEGALTYVEANTVSGAIRVNGTAPLAGAKLATISGSIELTGPLEAGGRFEFESVSGNIELDLPDDTSARFDLETFSGRISNRLAGLEAHPERSDKKKLSGQTFSGEAWLSAESFSGRITIR